MNITVATCHLSAYRDRVAALLGYVVESRLTGVAYSLGVGAADSPWDIWWVCYRAATPATELGFDVRHLTGGCAACRREVSVLVSTTPPGHPDRLGTVCGCLYKWAVRMRQLASDVDWLPLRTCVAMVKPDAAVDAVSRLLTETYQIVYTVERLLTAADVRRLYPDAYGADYVARQDSYLTSGPVRVLVLLASPTTTRDVKQIKAGIRRRLDGGDVLRNHLHMPDNPGDALCDVDHLAGSDLFHNLYERYDRDGAAERRARYRAVLALR